LRGDAAGEIDTSAGWTEAVREAYADRIQARIAAHAPGFDATVLKRVAFSPVDIERELPNMVGGDIYAGSCALDQNLLWRPRPGLPGHRTHVDRLWHIGASTHPGPGLGAGSGTLVAKALLK
jgi:phytoene dehydrogenase-like protein